MIGKIYRDDMVIVTIDGVPYTVNADDDRYDEVLEALAEDWLEEDILDVLTNKKAVNAVVETLDEAGIDFGMCGETVTYKGNSLPADLSGYLAAAIERGDASGIVAFVKRLFKSPSDNTRLTLFRFLETNHMPILDDGRFLAFKVVRSNYTDKHSGEFDNSPGAAPEVDWSEVDTDPNKTCSSGLHVCSRQYLRAFYTPGNRVVTVAVAPEDVGAVPYDYEGSKMRTKGYEVLTDITAKYVEETDGIVLSHTDACRDGLDWDDEEEDPPGGAFVLFW